jgi:hypothetical protein
MTRPTPLPRLERRLFTPNPRPWVYNLCYFCLICASVIGMWKEIL